MDGWFVSRQHGSPNPRVWISSAATSEMQPFIQRDGGPRAAQRTPICSLVTPRCRVVVEGCRREPYTTQAIPDGLERGRDLARADEMAPSSVPSGWGPM